MTEQQRKQSFRFRLPSWMIPGPTATAGASRPPQPIRRTTTQAKIPLLPPPPTSQSHIPLPNTSSPIQQSASPPRTSSLSQTAASQQPPSPSSSTVPTGEEQAPQVASQVPSSSPNRETQNQIATQPPPSRTPNSQLQSATQSTPPPLQSLSPSRRASQSQQDFAPSAPSQTPSPPSTNRATQDQTDSQPSLPSTPKSQLQSASQIQPSPSRPPPSPSHIASQLQPAIAPSAASAPPPPSSNQAARNETDSQPSPSSKPKSQPETKIPSPLSQPLSPSRTAPQSLPATASSSAINPPSPSSKSTTQNQTAPGPSSSSPPKSQMQPATQMPLPSPKPLSPFHKASYLEPSPLAQPLASQEPNSSPSHTAPTSQPPKSMVSSELPSSPSHRTTSSNPQSPPEQPPMPQGHTHDKLLKRSKTPSKQAKVTNQSTNDVYAATIEPTTTPNPASLQQSSDAANVLSDHLTEARKSGSKRQLEEEKKLITDVEPHQDGKHMTHGDERSKQKVENELLDMVATSMKQTQIQSNSVSMETAKPDTPKAKQLENQPLLRGKKVASTTSEVEESKIVYPVKKHKSIKTTEIDTHPIALISHGERPSPRKEIKEDISKFVHKLAGHPLEPGNELALSVITLAGENRGASMNLIPKEVGKGGLLHIHRHYKINKEDKAEESSDVEGTSKEQLKDKRSKISEMNAPYINSNMQSINNSILYSSSCRERSPGVQFTFFHGKATEAEKAVESKELIKVEKANSNTNPALRLTSETNVRRRCLRGLLMESSDSENEDHQKPRRHGCRYSSSGKVRGGDDNKNTTRRNGNV